MGFRNDIRKYVNYVFDTKSFIPTFDPDGISDHALQSARLIRGTGRGPAIIVQGIMPRSGTVYVGELLRLHPDLYAYPNQIWEVPFLQLAGDILDLQKKFFLAYEQNIGKLGEKDFLPVFGSSLIAYLYSFVPDGQRLLIKVPGVQYLDYFFSMFPYENLLLLGRDGRDVVHSTLKTWPQLRFSFVCRRWRRSARMVLEFHKQHSEESSRYWLARFEDAVRDPVSFVTQACQHFNLDESKYPFEEIKNLPIRGSSSTLKQRKVVWDPVATPEDFNPVGRWKIWPAGKKRRFKRIAGQALIDLGYCQDLSW